MPSLSPPLNEALTVADKLLVSVLTPDYRRHPMMMFSAHLVQYCVTDDNISGEGRRLVRLSLQ